MQNWEEDILTTILAIPIDLATDVDVRQLVAHALMMRPTIHDRRIVYELDMEAKERAAKHNTLLDMNYIAAYLSGEGPLECRWEGLHLHMTEEDSTKLANMPYQEFLQTPYWKTVRDVVVDRDKCCQVCSATQKLHVHHKTYKYRGCEFTQKGLETLITLCASCHATFHKASGAEVAP